MVKLSTGLNKDQRKGKTMSYAQSKNLSFLIGVALLFSLAACTAAAPSPVVVSNASEATASPVEETQTTVVVTENPAVESPVTATAPVTDTPVSSPDYSLFSIQQAFSKLYITASAGVGVAGSTLTQEPGGSAENQIWRFTTLDQEGSGVFLIQSFDGSMCLENTGSSILQKPCSDADNQKWMAVPCLQYKGSYICEKTNGSSVYLQSKQPLESNSYINDFGVSFTGKVMGLLDCDAFSQAEDPNQTACSTAGWQINSQGVTGGYDLQWYLIPRD
jgi:hypothetical protein